MFINHEMLLGVNGRFAPKSGHSPPFRSSPLSLGHNRPTNDACHHLPDGAGLSGFSIELVVAMQGATIRAADGTNENDVRSTIVRRETDLLYGGDRRSLHRRVESAPDQS